MSYPATERLIDKRVDLLAKLAKWQRRHVADICVKRVQRVMDADDITERDELEARMVWDYANVPERFDAEFGA